MKTGFNIAIVCVIASLCIAAVAITALAQGHDGTLVALSFAALGAIPAGIIGYAIKKLQNSKIDKIKGDE